LIGHAFLAAKKQLTAGGSWEESVFRGHGSFSFRAKFFDG